MSNKVKLMEITDNLLAQYNTDINGNIQAIHIIREQVVGSKDFSVVLGQIPDSQQGVAIINPDNFYEVFNYDDLTEQSYYRKDRRVYFHPSMSGKTVKVDYYGIGIDLISASSIYTRIDDHGNIIETLDDIFEVGKAVLDGLRTMGDTVTIIQQLKDTNIESANLLRQISNAITQLQTSIKVAESTNDILNNTIKNGDNQNKIWGKTINDGNSMNSTLTETTRSADGINIILNSTKDEAKKLNDDLVKNSGIGSSIDTKLMETTKKGEDVLSGLENHEINVLKERVDLAVKKTGDTITGTLKFKTDGNEQEIYNNGGTKARGQVFKSSNESILGMFGGYMKEQVVEKMFMGATDSPWNGVNSLTVDEKGTYFNNKKLIAANDYTCNKDMNNGFRKTPDGIIEQWGGYDFTGNIYDHTVALPLAYSITNPRINVQIFSEEGAWYGSAYIVEKDNSKNFRVIFTGGQQGKNYAIRWRALGF